MKLSCDVIRDLLPLYTDGVCSQRSRELVEEHLAECQTCKALLQENEKLPDLETSEPLPEAETKAVKGFKKLRRRWAQSIIAVLLTVPLVCMTAAQIMGRGVCFTNLDDILLAKRYVKALQSGDMEKAASLFNYEEKYQELKELAERSESDYMPHWEQTNVAGKMFYVNMASDPGLTEESSGELDPGAIIYNSQWRALVPISLWDEFTRENGFDPDPNQSSFENGKTYVQIETPWGPFMSPNQPEPGFAHDAEYYASVYNVLPAEIYERIEPDLMERGRKEYQQHQRIYRQILTQSLEEFSAEMKDRYTATLKTAFQNVSVDDIHYDRAYESDGGSWQVEVRAKIFEAGQESDGRFVIFTNDGRISSLGLSGCSDSNELPELSEYIYPRYWFAEGIEKE